MQDILIYESKLAADNELKDSIGELIKYIINEKKFQFKKEDLKFDINQLESNGIVKISEQHLEISNSSLFFNQFFLHYSNKYTYTLTANIDEAFSFIAKVDEDFKTAGYNAGIFSFFKRFSRFMLFLLHKEFSLDFSEYILNLNKATSGQRLYDFCNSYCKILPYLQTDGEIIYKNLAHLLNEVTDETVRFNSNVGEIRNSLTYYCKSNSEKGIAILDYAQNQNPVVVNLNSAIIQGIYEIKRNDYWEQIETISLTAEYRLSIMLALSAAKAETDVEAQKHFDLVYSFKELSDLELFNLPQFLVSIINNKNGSPELKKTCLGKLEELITNSNQNLRGIVLSEISFINGFDDERIEILKKLIATADFNKEQINSVAQVFINNKSLQGFIELIHLYAVKYKLDFNAEIFSSAFYHFRNDQPEKLSIELIKLLTHDLGEIRFVGSRILNYLTPHNGHFIFQTDILQLDALTQYKLWMSIFGETKEPGVSIPMLLPLLRSSFPFVKEAFIGRMELLTEEYGSSVAETLQKELDLNISENVEVLDRIKKYADDFWNEISKKRNIKEFNPVYTQSELYTLHSTNYGKSFNKSLSENVHKGSIFMQFATTVILAKGGGWKHEKHSKVAKLGQVSTSFQLPRSYFISPESFDWNFRKHYIKNWKNILKKWEAIISS